jgi:hypothetical protein
MRKYLPIYEEAVIVIYDIATAPFWIFLYMRKILSYFLSVWQCFSEVVEYRSPSTDCGFSGVGVSCCSLFLIDGYCWLIVIVGCHSLFKNSIVGAQLCTWERWGALCRSMSPNFNVPNINVQHINGSLLYFNREWLKFRANWLYQKLCRSTALYINKNNLEGRLHSEFHYFTLTVSYYHFSNKAVELQFLVLPCLKSDIQRQLMSNNGTMSEDVLQKLI